MRFAILIILSLAIAIPATSASFFHQNQPLLSRLIRASGARKQECRYEKTAWEECDPASGIQRRALKLKTSRSASTNCEQVKFITRPCKKACRYAKGAFTDCVNGQRFRIDQLKNGATSVGCEPIRNITKACKEPCRYTKSEWSPCENGIKTKTLTLTVEGQPGAAVSNCEPMKTIRKQCGQNKQRANKQGRTERKNRKNNNSQE